MRTRCLVLGGRGFLGSHLTEALARAGHWVRSFDRPDALRPIAITDDEEALDIETMTGDFLSEGDVARALEGVDVCFHLISTTIASTSNDDPCFDIETNLIGTLRLLDAAVAAGVRRVVFASSGGTVYGIPRTVPIAEDHPTDPICSYGIAKLSIEKYLQLYRLLHGLDSVVLRVANPYGERQRLDARQGAIAVFLGLAMHQKEITIWGDGSTVRDYLHINDVTDAFLATLGDIPGSHRVFNIGSGCGQSINEILDAIEAVTGKPTHRNYQAGRPFDVPINVLNVHLVERTLGWSPQIRLEEGLGRFYRWILRQEGA